MRNRHILLNKSYSGRMPVILDYCDNINTYVYTNVLHWLNLESSKKTALKCLLIVKWGLNKHNNTVNWMWPQYESSVTQMQLLLFTLSSRKVKEKPHLHHCEVDISHVLTMCKYSSKIGYDEFTVNSQSNSHNLRK